MQDLNDKVTGGTLTAVEWNEVPSEIQNVIVDTGQALTSADLNQLGKGVAQYSADGNFYTDTGGANAYALGAVGLKQAAVSYTDGLMVRFVASNTSSAASTVNVNSIGVKSIVRFGQPITGAEISGMTTLQFDLANDRFEIIPESDGVPTQYISGLETSNAADADHDVTIGVGIARDENDSAAISLTSPITKQIDAVWTEGTNLGGRASAVSLSVDTWYHLFVISKPDGTVDAGWDTDIDATNLLSDATGFTFFRRAASNLTDASSNILPQLQDGDNFNWKSRIEDFNSANTGTSGITVTVDTPLGVATVAKLIFLVTATSAVSFIATQIDGVDIAPSNVLSDLFVNVSGSIATQRTISTNTSSQVRIRASVSSAGITMTLSTLGYIDSRGQG